MLALIGQLYTCPSLNEFPLRVLTLVRKIIPSISASYNEVNIRQKRAVAVIDPPMPESFVPHFRDFEQLIVEHPHVAYMKTTGDGQAMKISDFVSARDYHRMRLYQTVYKHVTTEDQLSIGIVVKEGFVIGVAMNRDARTFTEKDRLRLNLLRPHIIQSYALLQERQGSLEQVADLRKALSEVGAGMISVDSAGDVIHNTPGVFDVLTRYIAVPEPMGSKLPAPISKWVKNQGDANSMVLDGKKSALKLHRVRRVDRTLLILSEITRAEPSDHLARYKLTKREHEVLHWFGEGKSNSDIAVLLKISSATVKNHAERIFAKLGVFNRTQAAMFLHNPA
jgi:DNA-binding CsgD family transcriptional regulator